MAYIPFGILWKFGEAIRNPQSGYGLTVGIISMAYIITVRHIEWKMEQTAVLEYYIHHVH
jgi:hypothetical protein